MKTLLTAAALLALLAAIALGALYGGAYDVAATSPETGVVAWALETAQERSVARRARAVEVPPLDRPELRAVGLIHYHEMCVTCHGAPGVPASEIGAGLNPFPPELAEEAEEYGPAELFWMVKNGIKMTGMPAFGPTHTDEELWAIVAFVESLPEMSGADYAAAVRAAGLAGLAGEAAEPPGAPGEEHSDTHRDPHDH
ncbi:MAG TPA: cytochrome c [Thermoanaerobaculia bacterium]|nr:cytochrome c [Thermoanaerobaculia bacterium]